MSNDNIETLNKDLEEFNNEISEETTENASDSTTAAVENSESEEIIVYETEIESAETENEVYSYEVLVQEIQTQNEIIQQGNYPLFLLFYYLYYLKRMLFILGNIYEILESRCYFESFSCL